MTPQRDAGYILASVIGVLLAISIVAATLVKTSVESLARVRRAENAARLETTLQAAIALVGSQLVTDPRRRVIDLTSAKSIPVLGREVKLRIGWESSKVDVNLAELNVVEARLRASTLAGADLETALTATRAHRVSNEPIRLISDLEGDQTTQDCLSSILTVFGGQTAFDPKLKPSPLMIGRPAAGSRLAIDLAVSGEEVEGLSLVILITGDSITPWQVLDWRRSSILAGEPCYAA